MKHTKGKWEVLNKGNGNIRVGTKMKDPLNQNNVATISGYCTDEESIANAKLIAAAPFKHNKEVGALDKVSRAVAHLDSNKPGEAKALLIKACLELDEAIKAATE